VTGRGDRRHPAKIEGMSLMPDGKLLLVNDNDFGIAGDATRSVIVDGTDIGPRRGRANMTAAARHSARPLSVDDVQAVRRQPVRGCACALTTAC
jgi:hypothetical protein